MEKPSREQQKLVYWLITDYANFKNGKSVGSSASLYEIYKAKDEIKKFYIKHIKYRPRKNSLEEFLELLDKYKDKPIGKDLYDMKIAYTKSIQDFCLNYENFSLSLRLMSKKGYRQFIEYIFDFMNDKQIPYRKEIAELLKENENEYYLFQCLKYKKCYKCGEYGELHHLEQVGTEGYKSDYGQLTYTCLCRKHHSEAHSDGRVIADGIRLNEKQLEILKNVYKNHFKGENKNGNNGK